MNSREKKLINELIGEFEKKLLDAGVPEEKLKEPVEIQSHESPESMMRGKSCKSQLVAIWRNSSVTTDD